jgi:hypothetical protein
MHEAKAIDQVWQHFECVSPATRWDNSHNSQIVTRSTALPLKLSGPVNLSRFPRVIEDLVKPVARLSM